MIHTLETIANVLLWCIAVSSTLHTLLYFTVHWYRSWLGRGVMLMSIGLALLVDVSIFLHRFPLDLISSLWIEIVILFLIFIGVLFQFLVLIRIRFSSSKNTEGKPNAR